MKKLWLLIICLAAMFAGMQATLAQGTAFTYQGRLQNSGSPVNGNYDLTFNLYATNATGTPVVIPVTNTAVAVTNGLFTTTIDFGAGTFTGSSNWLEIAVRTNNSGLFMTLVPRQMITPTPYAIYAPNAGSAATISGTVSATQLIGTLSSGQLSGGYSGPVSFLNGNNNFGGNGGGLTNISLSGIGPAGTFTLLPFYFGPAITYNLIQPNSVQLVDVNNDGLPDLICTVPTYSIGGVGAILVYTNAGNGMFVPASTNLDANGTVYSVAVGDLNQDGNPDLVVGDISDVVIYQGNGDGTFKSVQTNSVSFALSGRAVAVADINGDGFPEIIIGNSGTSLSVLVNFGVAGAFDFTQGQVVALNNNAANQLAVTDVNGDGKPDLLFLGNSGVVVLTNRNNTFVMASTNAAAVSPNSFVLGDVNGDGRPDLITASISLGTISVYTNAGGGIFTSNRSFTVGNGPAGLAVVTNSAGLVTYLGVANGNDATLQVLANDGRGNFTTVGVTPIGFITLGQSMATPLATADLNGDGQPDFVAVSYGSGVATELFGYPQVVQIQKPISLTNGENQISGYFSGNGSSLSNLNASLIMSGTLAVAQLPAGVALVSSNQVFTGVNNFNNTANTFDGTFAGSSTVSSFSGKGSLLQNLNASALTFGTVPLAAIPTPTVVTNSASNVTLSGTFSGNGGGLTNTPTAGNYVFAYDTTTQTIGTANTFQDVTFNSNGLTNGWIHTPSAATFTCGQAGTYLVQYSATAESTSGTVTGSLRAVLNGTEVTGSQSSITFATASAPAVISRSFLVICNLADVIKIQFTASTTSAALLSNNGSGTTRPGIACTIIRIQ